MKIYNKDEIKEVIFTLENCENIIIPNECFESLIISENGDECEIEANIIDNGKLDGYLFDKKQSPLQRLNYYPDICWVNLELYNGDKITYNPVWCDADYNGENNEYQKTELLNYKEIKLSINKNNKKLSISEVLKLDDGTIIIDEYGKEYKVEEDGCKYLFDTYVTDKIINSKFIIKQIQ